MKGITVDRAHLRERIAAVVAAEEQFRLHNGPLSEEIRLGEVWAAAERALHAAACTATLTALLDALEGAEGRSNGWRRAHNRALAVAQEWIDRAEQAETALAAMTQARAAAEQASAVHREDADVVAQQLVKVRVERDAVEQSLAEAEKARAAASALFDEAQDALLAIGKALGVDMRGWHSEPFPHAAAVLAAIASLQTALASMTAERDRFKHANAQNGDSIRHLADRVAEYERDITRLMNVVCDTPACTAPIIRNDDGSRVCARGHAARWVNVERLRAVEAQAATVREALEWRPIETAPQVEGETILLWDAKREVAVSGYWWVEPTTDSPNGYEPGWSGWSCDDDLMIWDDPDNQPTHWKPLGPAPRRTEGKGACPACGNEHVGADGCWTCECPKPPAPRRACMVPAPDQSGRTCDTPEGHDGDHWTDGGHELTWPPAPRRTEATCDDPDDGLHPADHMADRGQSVEPRRTEEG